MSAIWLRCGVATHLHQHRDTHITFDIHPHYEYTRIYRITISTHVIVAFVAECGVAENMNYFSVCVCVIVFITSATALRSEKRPPLMLGIYY